MAKLLKDLEINEISLVDLGANEGAKVVLFKRDDNKTSINKEGLMSDTKNWFKALAEKAGFSKEETEELEKTIPDNSEEIAELKAKLEEAKEGNNVEKLEAKIAELEKAAKPEPKPEPEDVFKGVSPELKKRFEDMEKALKTSQEEVKKANERATENEEKFNKSEDARKLENFTKTAEKDYPNIPGDPKVKGRILKAITEKMSEEDAKELTTMLAAGEEGLRKAMAVTGFDGSPKEDTAQAEIMALANEMVEKKEAKTVAQAILKVATSKPELYKRYKSEIQ